ncbi:MAG TPA: CcmD family protein [Terriglobales bacterium]|nr:CcmD family protein [Terriglobales bacterium]
MNSIHYLKAAYAATWIIHLTYISILYRRYRRLRREIDQLKGK